MNITENVLEWITGDTQVTITLSQKKFITKVKKLAEKYPDEVEIIHTNPDGSIVCHLPLRAIKINLTPKREYTEEQIEVLRERMKRIKESGEEVDEDDLDDEE